MRQHDDAALADVDGSEVPARLSRAAARSRVGMRHESNNRSVRSRRADVTARDRGADRRSDRGADAGSSGKGGDDVEDEKSDSKGGEELEEDLAVPLPAWPLPPVATPSVDHPPLSAFSDTDAFVSYVAPHGDVHAVPGAY